MILSDVHRKSIKHSSVWCRGNLKRHIYSIQKFKATRFYNVRLTLENTSLLCNFAFFFKEHTNRWRYIFPISAQTAASTLFVRASIMLKSLVLLRRGHVQHQPAPLRGHRTNTGAALRFSWRRSEFAVQTSRRLLQHFGWFRERKKQQENNTKSFGRSGEAACAGIPRFQVTIIKTPKEGLQFEPSLKVN